MPARIEVVWWTRADLMPDRYSHDDDVTNTNVDTVNGATQADTWVNVDPWRDQADSGRCGLQLQETLIQSPTLGSEFPPCRHLVRTSEPHGVQPTVATPALDQLKTQALFSKADISKKLLHARQLLTKRIGSICADEQYRELWPTQWGNGYGLSEWSLPNWFLTRRQKRRQNP